MCIFGIHWPRISLILTILISFSLYGCGESNNNSSENINLSLLGENLFFDENLSSSADQSCATCHDPDAGFTGPISEINAAGATYPGAVAERFGNRKPPSAAYATQSPVFYFDSDEELFLGGNFWDGRATGERLGSPAAEQALGPFLNPVEMNMPSQQAVCEAVAASNYVDLFASAFPDVDNPIDCVNDISGTYDRIGLAIAAFEKSSTVNAFTSKYDYYLLGQAELTEQEAAGLLLFEGAGQCNLCHPSELGPDGELPLFTDFSFDNLGVPKNMGNLFYTMNTVLVEGSPINSQGNAWVDNGLGAFLEASPEPAYAALAAENLGKQKVPTLRNVDKRPDPTFIKAYAHNGHFKSLKEIVHFYNTRDILPVCSGGDTPGVDCWPAPEVADNVNVEELGNLGLTDQEEDDIVAFLKTLSDGYLP